MIEALQNKCKTCFEVNLNLHLPQALFKMFTSIANKSAPPCFDKPQNNSDFLKRNIAIGCNIFLLERKSTSKGPQGPQIKSSQGNISCLALLSDLR